MSKNTKRLEFWNARTQEKVKTFVEKSYVKSTDIVSLEDICLHLKRDYSEF